MSARILSLRSSRRNVLAGAAFAGGAVLSMRGAAAAPAPAASMKRKMTNHLTPGAIGVKATQQETIAYAKQYGFEAVEAFGGYLATLEPGEIDRIAASVKAAGLVWGNASLTVEFRKDDATFQADLAAFPRVCQALQRAGVTRLGTWISPSSATVPYVSNFKQHSTRLSAAARIAASYGLRLGLEYVGPKTLWAGANRFPFIHTMAEMRELIASIGSPAVGLLLDSWHWYTAGESRADILALRNEDVISVDLNDAPAGIERDQQVDSRRELPMATGVIPLADFLNALHQIGFDGPVRCEPFNAPLRAMPADQALAAVAQSMKKALSLIKES